MSQQIHVATGRDGKPLVRFYTRGGSRMAQVVIHSGEGSSRKSTTVHAKLSGRVWVGNNPDPRTVSRRENAARLVANASANLKRIQTEIVELEKLVSRELTDDEMAMFKRQGFTTPERIKEVVEKVVIPTLRLHLQSAKVAQDGAKTIQADVNEAYPLQVEFVGF